MPFKASEHNLKPSVCLQIDLKEFLVRLLDK